jgi:hypothetical protein
MINIRIRTNSANGHFKRALEALKSPMPVTESTELREAFVRNSRILVFGVKKTLQGDLPLQRPRQLGKSCRIDKAFGVRQFKLKLRRSRQQAAC